MNQDLSEEAIAFGAALIGAVQSAGGDRIVQTAEASPHDRHTLVGDVLAPLGVWDLLPRSNVNELEAAAVACRVAGRFALPYPVAERLAGLSGGGDALVAVTRAAPMANVLHVPLRWVAGTIDGTFRSARPAGRPSGGKLGPFLDHLELGEPVDADPSDLALAMILPCWTVLGSLERAFELTHLHVSEREQFGQPLLGFQVVQFQLADAVVALTGLEQLAKHALWSSWATPADSITDALALRVAMLDAAGAVFRIAHQLHGASGFCDESPLSWLSRHTQPIRRAPFGLADSELHLTTAVLDRGLQGLFSPA